MKTVRFARGLNENSGGFIPYQDEQEEQLLSVPLYLITNKGEEQPLSNVSMLANVDQDGRFEVVLQVGSNLTGVEYVTFRVGNNDTGIREQVVGKELRLLTPVHFELKLSGCDDATEASVYNANGVRVASATVSNGSTTILVGNLPAGVYVAKVGSKSLKFIKK